MKPNSAEIAFCFVLPAGLEPATFSFVARHSNPTELWEPFFNIRETDGTRTHDNQTHKLALYHLSYGLRVDSGTSWSRTTFSGFSVQRIHQVCQSSFSESKSDYFLNSGAKVRRADAVFLRYGNYFQFFL